MRDIKQKGLHSHNLRNILEFPLNGMRFPIIQTRWIPADGCITTNERVGQFHHIPPTNWKLSCNSELTSSNFIDAIQIIMLYFVELSTKWEKRTYPLIFNDVLFRILRQSRKKDRAR